MKKKEHTNWARVERLLLLSRNSAGSQAKMSAGHPVVHLHRVVIFLLFFANAKVGFLECSQAAAALRFTSPGG